MNTEITPVTRRSFLRRGSAGLAGAALVFPHIVNAQAAKAIKIGIVGCGGRGTGALTDAMNADSNVVLTAMGDIAADQLESRYKNIAAAKPDQVKVEDKNNSSGSTRSIGCWPRTSMSCSSPRLPDSVRPTCTRRSMQGNTCFAKSLSASMPRRSATRSRRSRRRRRRASRSSPASAGATIWPSARPGRNSTKARSARSSAYYGTYLANTPWVKAREEGWTDLEWQLRNWMYFTWLSGDHLVEQAVHTVDKMSWAFKDVPPDESDRARRAPAARRAGIRPHLRSLCRDV